MHSPSVATKPSEISIGRFPGPLRWKRFAAAALLLVLAIAPGELGGLTRQLMTDAFVQVSVFVAATLVLCYGAERLFHFDIGESLSRAKSWQVPLAALLGATPGCGGAVVVVAAYSSGNVSFGAVVATLTATMGDAAFLLIAVKPEAAAVLLPLQFGVGILTGWIIDRFVRSDFRPSRGPACDIAPLINRLRWRDLGYLIAVLPGLAVGVAQIAQVELATVFGLPIEAVALTGVALGLFIWVTSPVTAMTNPKDRPVTRMAEETAFISVWVIFAYLAYDYLAAFAGLDLEAMFAAVAPVLPLFGALVGLIPGCGPQVVVATLYVNGAIPFSALIANAISNDGDALFPAIALAPRAAVMATVYSTVPALIVAYGFYFLAPGFLN